MTDLTKLSDDDLINICCALTQCEQRVIRTATIEIFKDLCNTLDLYKQELKRRLARLHELEKENDELVMRFNNCF